MKITFSVDLSEEYMFPGEEVAVFGSLPALGEWNVHQALRLKPASDSCLWTGDVDVPANTAVLYRYFITMIDPDTHSFVVRRWESHVVPREYLYACNIDCCNDRFGYINENQRTVRYGWLSCGNMVEFKLFKEAMTLVEPPKGNETLRIKLEPIDPRDQTIIVPSARAYTEYVRMLHGDSAMHPQPDQGVPYKNNDLLIFYTFVMTLEKVGYMLKLYAVQSDKSTARLIGQHAIHPRELQRTNGELTATLSSLTGEHTVGTLRIEYLVVGAMRNYRTKPSTTFLDYWKPEWKGLDIGHRGLGKSFVPEPAALPENTIASFLKAMECGADMVEFDVMLTKDMVPIIYHDWDTYVAKDKTKKPTSTDDLELLAIHEQTLEQLNSFTTYKIVNDEIREYPAPKTVSNENERMYPTLAQTLCKTPKELAFNIEVKWPQDSLDGLEAVQNMDKDVYLNRIIDVMQQFACGRYCVCTCFDPEICVMITLKQNIYPVMFLLNDVLPYYADARADSVQTALCTAQAYGLLGIVPAYSIIAANPDIVNLAQRSGKLIMLWGDELDNDNVIANCKKMGVTGIIYDNLVKRMKREKSLFQQDAELAQLLQKMCK